MNRRLSLDGFAGTTVSGRRISRSQKGSKQEDTLQDAHVRIKDLQQSLEKNSPDRDPNMEDEGLKRFDGLVAKNSFKKHNLTFHKLFEDIPETERLTATFTCSLKELFYHGRVFVSEDHICFHSSVLLKHIKVVLATSDVCGVKRHKAPVPMLSIYTVDRGKYNLLYVKHRKTCYELLKSVCLHVEKESANTSPQMSSAENGGNDMMSGYSSFDESMNSRNNSISLDESYRHSATFTGENTPTYRDSILWNEETDSSLSQGIADKTTSPAGKGTNRTLNCIFYMFWLLFLLLVLVSGYIGLRIIALEEQLTALGDLSL